MDIDLITSFTPCLEKKGLTFLPCQSITQGSIKVTGVHKHKTLNSHQDVIGYLPYFKVFLVLSEKKCLENINIFPNIENIVVKPV